MHRIIPVALGMSQKFIPGKYLAALGNIVGYSREDEKKESLERAKKQTGLEISHETSYHFSPIFHG